MHECNEAWKRLINGQAKHNGIALHNLTVAGSAAKVTPADQAYKSLPEDSRAAPAPIDPSIDKTFYISGHAV